MSQEQQEAAEAKYHLPIYRERKLLQIQEPSGLWADVEGGDSEREETEPENAPM